MKRRNFAHRPGCAVEAMLDLIDGKCKDVIPYYLQDKTQRFGGGGCPALPSAC